MNGLLLALVAVLLTGREAAADGGTVQARETAGPFVVTVFTDRQALGVGTTDVSVLVQDEHGDAVLDADVALRLDPAAGGPAIDAAATRAEATNKLLYAAPVQIGAPGAWRLRVLVTRGRDRAEIGVTLAVGPAPPALWSLWPYLALPPAAILLFAVHQMRLRTVSARPATRGSTTSRARGA